MVLQAQLKAALASGSFMRKGGQISCALTHLYPASAEQPFEPTVLRGADAAILAAAAQLGLKAKVIQGMPGCSGLHAAATQLRLTARDACCLRLLCFLSDHKPVGTFRVKQLALG